MAFITTTTTYLIHIVIEAIDTADLWVCIGTYMVLGGNGGGGGPAHEAAT